jgi:hypothetical protein
MESGSLAEKKGGGTERDERSLSHFLLADRDLNSIGNQPGSRGIRPDASYDRKGRLMFLRLERIPSSRQGDVIQLLGEEIGEDEGEDSYA